MLKQAATGLKEKHGSEKLPNAKHLLELELNYETIQNFILWATLLKVDYFFALMNKHYFA